MCGEPESSALPGGLADDKLRKTFTDGGMDEYPPEEQAPDHPAAQLFAWPAGLRSARRKAQNLAARMLCHQPPLIAARCRTMTWRRGLANQGPHNSPPRRPRTRGGGREMRIDDG